MPKFHPHNLSKNEPPYYTPLHYIVTLSQTNQLLCRIFWSYFTRNSHLTLRIWSEKRFCKKDRFALLLRKCHTLRAITHIMKKKFHHKCQQNTTYRTKNSSLVLFNFYFFICSKVVVCWHL